jgi:hypothetical protein
MRRLRTCTRLLSAVLVALIARMFIVGLNAAIELAGSVVVPLLIGALLLLRQGRRINPDATGDQGRRR